MIASTDGDLASHKAVELWYKICSNDSYYESRLNKIVNDDADKEIVLRDIVNIFEY